MLVSGAIMATGAILDYEPSADETKRTRQNFIDSVTAAGIIGAMYGFAFGVGVIVNRRLI